MYVCISLRKFTNIYTSHTPRSHDSSAGTMASTRDGLPNNLCSIPGRGKTLLFPETSIPSLGPIPSLLFTV